MHNLGNYSDLIKNERGFTIVELLVASTLGLIVTGLLLGLTQANREVLGKDMIRTGLNQNIRGALDLMGADIRVGGENLGSTFPAIELINATGGDSDQLLIRRNLLDEVLPVCTAITAGSTVTNIYFAVPGTVAGCVYSGHTHNYNSWRNYRLSQTPAQALAYIYNSATKLGEFFLYTSEVNTGTAYYLTRSAGTWANSYPTASSAIYMLEEWRYRLVGENLQVIVNRDTANPFNVSFGLTDFLVRIEMQDNTFETAFTANDSWTSIKTIEVTLSGQDTFSGETLTQSMVGEFFPRNILSH